MIELRPGFRNAIAGFCAAVAIGCHTTRKVNLVENPNATTRPSRIDVVTKSGSTVVIYRPVIRQDSVRGFSDESGATPVTIAVNEIQQAKTRQFSGGRTALLTIGIIGAVFLVAWAFLIALLLSEDTY